MIELHVSDAIRYVGVDDTTIDLFESQYPVPNGVSYNSYVILDEKVAVMDTVDRRAAPDWLENLEAELKGRAPTIWSSSTWSLTTPAASACWRSDIPT